MKSFSLRPSLDQRIHAEKKTPPSSTLAENTSTAVTREPVLEWKLGRKEALIVLSLMIVSLVAALDATVLVPVLPVSKLMHVLT